MDFVHKILLALHLLGMGAIVGGWLVSRGSGRVPAAVLWGARAQVVTGILLVGVAEMVKDDDFTVNHTKIAVKLVLALVVAAMAEIGNARAKRGEPSSTQLDAAGGGAVAAVLVAALW